MQMEKPAATGRGTRRDALTSIRGDGTQTARGLRAVNNPAVGSGGSALGSGILLLASVGLYAASLQYGYRDFVAPSFSYAGLGYRSPNPASYAGMILLTALVAALLPLRLRTPSDFVLWMLFCLVGAPSILIAQYNSKIPSGASVPTGLAVALTMLTIRFGALARPRVPEKLLARLSSEIVWIGLVAVAVITYVAILLTSGISVSWLAFDDVYSVRSDYMQIYAALPLLGYLVPLVSNVINPVLMARGLFSRRYLLLAIGGVGQYILYVTTGNKVILFSIPAIAGLTFLFRGDRNVKGRHLLLSISFVALGTVILDLISASTLWTGLILRRFIIVPGALTAGYIYVFLGQPKTHFADSPLKWLKSPYGDLLPSFLVGIKFVGDPTTNANASLFGHGFAAYGYVGMVIEGLALVPVLWLLDTLAKGLPIKVAALVLLMPSVALAGASVFTSILTHGLLFAALVLAVLPREGWQRSSPRAGAPPLQPPSRHGGRPSKQAS